jgi:predicted ATPase/DNA-binding CsgD family transcriptional regulator
LLVLDNCEHVIVDIAQLVDELLRTCPNLSVLATSRIGLGVPGELTWRVPALSLPPSQTRVSIGVLGQFDAVRLFVERAKRVRPNFVLDDANGPAVAEICQRLDGIPLALELAAARCRSLSPAQIRAGLNDSLRLLTGGGRTVLPRQQTLQASIEWSYSLLTDVDRALLRRLSVFIGGFDLTAAEAVAVDRQPALGALRSLDVLDGMDRLVEQSLVAVDDDRPGAGSRYRLLETVRQYARGKLVDHEELDTYLDAHCDYFRSWSVNWAAHSRLIVDADNLLAAMSRAAHVCSTQAYVDFLAPMVGALTPTQSETQLDALLEACLQRLGPHPTIERARVLAVRGRVRLYAGRTEEMRGDALEALAIAEPLNADSLIGRALNLLGASYLLSDPGRAIDLLERAVAHSLAAEDWIMAIATYGDLGLGHAARRDLQGAISAYDAHAALERDHPSLYMLANEQAGRAQVAWLGAEYEDASRLLASTRGILDQLGGADDPWLVPFVTFIETSVALERGEQLDEATTAELRARFDHALTRQQFVGVYFLAKCLMLAAVERADAAEARRFGDLLTTFGSAGLAIVEVDGRSARAALHHDTGALAAAMADVEHGRAACEIIGDDISAALFDIRAGLIALSGRDIGEAERLIHAALRTVSDRGFRREVVIALEAVALAGAASGNWTDVARLHGAAGRLRDELGYRLRTSPEREAYAEAIGSLSADHADAIAEGTSMNWRAAAEYALRTWGARKRPAFGWQSLTPTELQVVGLAAKGLTNPQIADQLIMGRATVKTHLSNAYTKLGVKNRTELATRAASERAERESPSL